MARLVWFFDPQNTKSNPPKNQICASQKTKIHNPKKPNSGTPKTKFRRDGGENTKTTWFVEGRTTLKRIAAKSRRGGPKGKGNVSWTRNAFGLLGAQEDLIHQTLLDVPSSDSKMTNHQRAGTLATNRSSAFDGNLVLKPNRLVFIFI